MWVKVRVMVIVFFRTKFLASSVDKSQQTKPEAVLHLKSRTRDGPFSFGSAVMDDGTKQTPAMDGPCCIDTAIKYDGLNQTHWWAVQGSNL